jgi:hypothetical protein
VGPLLDAAFSFPTVLFTVLLMVVMLYWTLVLVGALGMDVLDGADGSFDGADGVDLGEGQGVAALLGFGAIPASIAMSILVFWAWATSLVGAIYLGPVLGGFLPVWLTSLVVLGVALGVALLASALSVKPLRPVFHTRFAPRRRSLLGKTAVVASGRVDPTFGQASMEDGGAGLVLSVFCAKPNELEKGDPVVLIQFDEQRQAYEVEPAEWLLRQKNG